MADISFQHPIELDTIPPERMTADPEAGAHIGTFVLQALRLLVPGQEARTLVDAALTTDDTPPGDMPALFRAAFALSPMPPHAGLALGTLGAGFTAAKACGHTPPSGVSQSQWNRALRDQGERCRAASLTLRAGRDDVARTQVSGVGEFLVRHFHHLPR